MPLKPHRRCAIFAGRGSRLALLFALLVVFGRIGSVWADTESFSGKVLAVSSGDRLGVMKDGRLEWVRLEGIYAPEPGQPYGDMAKGYLTSRCFKQTVQVLVTRRSSYQREFLGEVYLSDGLSLNKELVQKGLAWWYSPYSRDDELRLLELEARGARRNIWSEIDPIPPWEYRNRPAAAMIPLAD